MQSVHRAIRLLIALGAGAILLASLSLTLGGFFDPVFALPNALFVKPAGAGGACTQANPCSLPTALAQAQDGDAIYLAQGAYTGAGPAVITVTKSITLYGGWDGAPTGPVVRDPDAHPTVLDGEGQRRVVYIAPGTQVLMDGVRIIRGNASGLGAMPWNTHDAGGGMYANQATVILQNVVFTDNIAATGEGRHGFGGAACFYRGRVTISHAQVVSNSASLAFYGYGGGLFFKESQATVISSTLQRNTGSWATWGYGGGMDVVEGRITLENVSLVDNVATRGQTGFGGGLDIYAAVLTLRHSRIISNVASYGLRGEGGGIFIYRGDGSLIADSVIENNRASHLAAAEGGGIAIKDTRQIDLVANAIKNNRGTSNDKGQGGGIYLEQSTVSLDRNWVLANRPAGIEISSATACTLTNNIVAENGEAGLKLGAEEDSRTVAYVVHNTIAGNDACGVCLTARSQVTLVNNIVSVHTYGIQVAQAQGNALYADYTLFYGNDTDTSGGDITSSHAITGMDPYFVDPAAGDYHIGPDSAAIDAGVDAGVTEDIDGQPRPFGPAPDIGADEYAPAAYRMWLPILLQ